MTYNLSQIQGSPESELINNPKSTLMTARYLTMGTSGI